MVIVLIGRSSNSSNNNRNMNSHSGNNNNINDNNSNNNNNDNNSNNNNNNNNTDVDQIEEATTDVSSTCNSLQAETNTTTALLAGRSRVAMVLGCGR